MAGVRVCALVAEGYGSCATCAREVNFGETPCTRSWGIGIALGLLARTEVFGLPHAVSERAKQAKASSVRSPRSLAYQL
jgi:hypothetical protein